jgi:hypothetical protein
VEAEREIREQLEKRVGRSLSDEEWEAFKQAAAQRATDSSAGTTSPKQGETSAGRGCAAWLGVAITFVLIGAVLEALALGLNWAYDLNWTPWRKGGSGSGEEFFGTLLGGAVMFAFLGWISFEVFGARWSQIILAILLAGGTIALITGAIVRTA